MKIIIFLYDFILAVSVPFYFVSLALKKKFTRQALQRLRSIDGRLVDTIGNRQVIWLHAVSLGEVLTCRRLIQQLSLEYPHKIILITTVTPAGAKVAQQFAKDNVISSVMPFDFGLLISGLMQRIRPQVIILMETELWPNLLYNAQRQDVPVFVLNARISDRSFHKYCFFRPLFRNLSQPIRLFCVQSSTDRDRLSTIGVASEKIRITGNMKFDALRELDGREQKEAEKMRAALCLAPDGFFIVAGSTHHGEEECLVEALLEVRKRFAKVRLLLAPRHLERLGSIERTLEHRRVKSQRISRIIEVSNDTVLLLDTIGTLNIFYALANLVFVGGSLVPTGGHNILEPAFFGKPIIIGPYTHNFRSIVELFNARKAVLQLYDSKELAATIEGLMTDAGRLKALGAAARATVLSHQGATQAALNILRGHLS